MRRSASFVFLSAMLLSAPSAVSAQGLCGGALTGPAEGGYAEYRMTLGNGRVEQVRFAVVGVDTSRKGRPVWFENRVQRQGAPMVVSQVLVPGFPYQASSLLDASLQAGKGRPIHLTASQLGRARRQLPGLLRAIEEVCRSASLVGTETVRVGAGRLEARHYRNALRGSDIWVSSTVPFGIVKMTDGADKSAMELTGMGSDAKSSFSGSPQSAARPGP